MTYWLFSCNKAFVVSYIVSCFINIVLFGNYIGNYLSFEIIGYCKSFFNQGKSLANSHINNSNELDKTPVLLLAD